ncbi:MAG: hypothetical protein H7Z74_13825 [Anaerolineae bacterium]|nr:hypothetical protein [Gemmatimonadaceae bacterium]
MDDANNPPRKPTARPFFGPRSGSKTPPSAAPQPGRSAARPFTSRVTPSGQPVPASVNLASAAPPGEDVATAIQTGQPLGASTAVPIQGDVQFGEVDELVTQNAQSATFDIESSSLETVGWRPSDTFDAAAEAAAKSVVDPPKAEASSEAIGVVDIMDWMPLPGTNTDLNGGNDVSESLPTSTLATGTTTDDDAISVAPSDASAESDNSESGTSANADTVTLESTAAPENHTPVPTLATPAFGALTVSSEAEFSSQGQDDELAAVTASTAEHEPGDVWKWGEPASPEISENAATIEGDSDTIIDSNASGGRAAEGTTPAPIEAQPIAEVSAGAPISLEEIKESEPWTMSPANVPDRGNAIGDALERVAKRIREGEIILPPDTRAGSDEAALALALAALLRGGSE